MRLLIIIPKEFEQHFQADRFEDSLHRLSADAHLLAGNYEQETVVMLIEAFKSAVPVPPHGRLIDADAFASEMKKRQDACAEWRDSIKNGGGYGTELYYRADSFWGAMCETKLTLDKIPTIIEAEEGEA